MAEKLMLKNVRCSYSAFFEPKPVSKDQDAELKYGSGFIIPKDHPQIKEIKAVIDKVGSEKFGDAWKKIKAKKPPLYDGDAVDEDGELLSDDPSTVGAYTLNARSKRKPQVVDRKVQPILDESEIWSGCYVNASVAVFAFDVDVNKGVSFGLNNVQLIKEGERLGGAPNADQEFEEIEGDEDDGFAID